MKNLILLLLICAAFAQEPIKFRGAYIGQPLSDYVDCSSGKAKKLIDSYHPHGKLCDGKRGLVSHIKGHQRFLRGPVDEGEMLFFEDARLTRIKIFVPHEEDWEKIKFDLTQKLGPPVSEVPEVYQNGFGGAGNMIAASGSRATR